MADAKTESKRDYRQAGGRLEGAFMEERSKELLTSGKEAAIIVQVRMGTGKGGRQ